jgi:DNA-binding beta-propeller fold protein YncE
MRVAAVFCVLMTVGASAQMLQSRSYATTGHPTEALATPDGQFVLVTVDRGGGGESSSGIDVFHDTGKKLERIAFQALGSDNAQGIVLIPHTRMLAVGMSNKGLAFLPLDDALHGKAKLQMLPQGEQSGSGYLAVTPDGEYLFVANEYGDGGNLGVVALHRDEAGNVHPETLAHIATGRATPGVAISPDGSRIYTVGEVTRPEVAARLPGHGVAELERGDCVQGRPDRPMPNGLLYAIEVEKATKLSEAANLTDRRGVIVGMVNAGCSPVREAVSADGTTVYVTARGENRVLVFNAKVLETDPAHAFLRAIPTGGEAPVGLRLFHGDKALLVANSNRFARGPGNVAVIDLADPMKPVLRQTIQTGEFPRNITASADGERLFLTVFLGDELMVLTAK